MVTNPLTHLSKIFSSNPNHQCDDSSMVNSLKAAVHINFLMSTNKDSKLVHVPTPSKINRLLRQIDGMCNDLVVEPPHRHIVTS